MSWRDRLQPGSYRGVPFHVDSNDADLGLRKIVHRYPQTGRVTVENMGGDKDDRAQEFTLELFVLGDDYDRARDALEDALLTPGPAELVIPKNGRFTVEALTARRRESKSEGGKCSFSVTFIESADPEFPKATTDTAARVTSAASAARSALPPAFAKAFNVLQKPSFIAENAAVLVNRATDTLRVINGRIDALTSPLAELTRGIDQFGDELNTLLRQPASLVSDFNSLIGSVIGVAADVESAIRVYDALYVFGDDLDPAPQTTSNRQTEAENQAAMVQMVKTSAVIAHAEAASSPDAEYESIADAQTMRDTLVERIDDVSLTITDDDLYSAIVSLRAEVVRDLNQRIINLPRVINYAPPVRLPMLLIAWQLYGTDIDDLETRAEDIIARNKIRNPMFVEGGVELEALIDV